MSQILDDSGVIAFGRFASLSAGGFPAGYPQDMIDLYRRNVRCRLIGDF